MTTPELARLMPLCSTDESRKKVASPFAMTWAGRQWAVGTDGHVLAAVPFDGELRADGPDATKVVPAREPTHTASVTDLLAFAGEQETTDCGECYGSTKCNQCECGTEHECGMCAGAGQKRVIRYGLLLDGGLDRDYLRRVILSAPDGTREVRFGHFEPKGPFLFTAPGWIGLVMPIRPGSSELEGAPRFSVEPAAGAPSPTPKEK